MRRAPCAVRETGCGQLARICPLSQVAAIAVPACNIQTYNMRGSQRGYVSGCSDRAVDESPVGLLWQNSFVALISTLISTLSALYPYGVAWLGVHALHSGVVRFSDARYS